MSASTLIFIIMLKSSSRNVASTIMMVPKGWTKLNAFIPSVSDIETLLTNRSAYRRHDNQGPIRFMEGYNNPCWHEKFTARHVHMVSKNAYKRFNGGKRLLQGLKRLSTVYGNMLLANITERIRCLPYFHVIGLSKCGTSDLFTRLSNHPQVLTGFIKEPNWWSHFRFATKHPASFADLVDIYGEAALEVANNKAMCPKCDQMIIGDGSVKTLWKSGLWMRHFYNGSGHYADHAETLANFLNWVQPDAKLIVIMRNPTDRLFSDYLFLMRLQPVVPSQSDFHDKTVFAIEEFMKCTDLYSERHCVYDVDFTNRLDVRLHVGLYEVFLNDWLTVFQKSSFHFIRMEDYAANTLLELKRATRFLGLSIYSFAVLPLGFT